MNKAQIEIAPLSSAGERSKTKQPSTITIPQKYLEVQSRLWLNNGLSLAPVLIDGTKAAAVPWKDYQSERASLEVLNDWLRQGYGIGIIGGEVSGNLLILDFDEVGIFPQYMEIVKAEYPSLAGTLPIVETPSGGNHLYVRCSDPVKGNTPLARSNDKTKVRIETRGEGGYVLAPGCPPACHKLNKTYTLLTGDLTNIPIVTPDELEGLLRIAKIFDETPTLTEKIIQPQIKAGMNGQKRPGDEFNERGDIATILTSHGWKQGYSAGNKQTWKRPGKEDGGISATFNHNGCGLFYVFSANAGPFEQESYSKFAVYALLEHNGDYSAAASELAKKGYGDPAPLLKAITKHSYEEEEDCAPTGFTPTGYNLTDSGNAERFVRDWQGEIKYCESIGKWYAWEGGKWTQMLSGRANRLALETVRTIYAEAAQAKDRETRKEISRWAIGSEAAHKIRAMVDIAKNTLQLELRLEALDTKPYLLNCANGIIDLKTGILSDHDPNDLLSQQTAINYDPYAKAPLWEAFLERVIPDKAVRVFLQRAVGYTLTGDISEQCLFFLHGGGRNGKSTFIETVSALLGDYFTKTSSNTLMRHRNDDDIANGMAALRGSRMVVGSEIGDGQHLNTSAIKDMTGGDTMRGRFLYAEQFTFKPVLKLFLYGNHKPQIKQNDEGIWRRICLIPFEVQIPKEEQDGHLRDKLMQELSGILAWAVRGCLDWRANGLGTPDIVTKATDEYREEMDALAPFFEDCCVIDKEGRCNITDLWSAYKTWRDQNEDNTFETPNKFNHSVGGHEAIKRDKSNGAKIWRGIRLKGLFDEKQPLENTS